MYIHIHVYIRIYTAPPLRNQVNNVLHMCVYVCICYRERKFDLVMDGGSGGPPATESTVLVAMVVRQG